ncbi:undecaprenyldiphospho-muramoylpentapeptide beta-N-acetylglucosaminyltransferase [Nisaea acidiphila]|uniref:UDP-N-acetylglucosamine--N-acetylmuramyl-(pentapeptide) pyrophosphoryl-undecaprenol N-acetylglucosamine transferase n=1 Tax=Nisaea acidiphila TaxID=1862145 RepID=A0A9J7AN73_9PROT|nr:undecaprenyldiphospho-muramoylpentapeptide beta-N-acetylglucosaminyltransferase [Nisaea acidiphila]UUX49091.1 undecaprenyldiphospho-muramoylpentapeptide beta-N-acetylglucosaminyltransferase [Nisaea acidiphila]
MAGKTVILAAGGTGGHIFPALSLGQALVARGIRVALVTDDRGGRYEGENPDIAVRRIRAASPSRGGAVGKVKAIAELGIGALQAAVHMKSLGAGIAVGFGGYPSVPTVRAAAFLGLPVILHEQNAVLGRANRFLAGHATKIATSFHEMTNLSEHEAGKCHFTGNPVRENVLALRGERRVDTNGPLNLLVFGGSQGATVFSTVVPAAIAELPEDLRARLRITQQSRAEDIERVKGEYQRLGVAADIRAFFDDLPDRMASADLVIARSGASTIAELTTLGRPAILVPYPSAADDHQTANARAVEAGNAAWMMPEPDEFTSPKLAGALLGLLKAPDRLNRAAAAARDLGTPDAADRLADLVIATAPALAVANSNPQQGCAA